jgi:hypothetical protein
MQKLAVERTILSVDPLPTPPTAPDNITIEARNLGFLVQWSQVPGVDGYNVLISSDEDFSNPDTQKMVPGETTLETFIETGHIAVTRYFAVQSYKGGAFSDYNTVTSATTTQAQADFSSAADVSFDNTETDLTSKTVTATGGTLYLIGNTTLNSATIQNVQLRLYEDAVELVTVTVPSYSTTGAVGTPGILFWFRTPTAGSRTYKITAQNVTSSNTCFAKIAQLFVSELPLVVLAAAGAPPSTAPATRPPSEIPTGPSRRYGY